MLQFRRLKWVIVLFFLASCANIVPPSGGRKDVLPPKLKSCIPADSSTNSLPQKLIFNFDEFVQLKDAQNEIQIAPLLELPLMAVASNKKIIIKITDSLLQKNTTYHIQFGNAIQDLHEGNPFGNYEYVFSTGNYFDSLQLKGTVLNAATGLPDTEIVKILLYKAQENDTIVYRHKPLYTTATKKGGQFLFSGLPHQSFKIYALKDLNNNLQFDGGLEKIGFKETFVLPQSILDSSTITLHIFEVQDSTHKNHEQIKNKGLNFDKNERNSNAPYLVLVDTSDLKNRTQELTKPLKIQWQKKVKEQNFNKILLTYDSADVLIEAQVKFLLDTVMNKQELNLNTVWKENTVYTLRLQKGFAKDSMGVDFMPSKYKFRTKTVDDYGLLHVHLASKYAHNKYVLQIFNSSQTVYQKKVQDTLIHLEKLKPDTYNMRLILDENENGVWDTGDLLAHKQPEKVIPYLHPQILKAGWENTIDIE